MNWVKNMIKISRWTDTRSSGTNFTYSINDEVISNILIFDLMKDINKRISSYVARRYIEKNRDRIERLVKSSVLRRSIEREIRKLFDGFPK